MKEWVRAARQHAKLTQEQLGERLGLTKGNISGWENGRHAPSFDQVMKIEALTGFPIENNVGDVGDRNISLRVALSVLDDAAQKAPVHARQELQKAFDLYLTDPRRYSRLMGDIEELLSGELPMRTGTDDR